MFRGTGRIGLAQERAIFGGIVGIKLQCGFKVGDGKVEISEIQMGEATVLEDFSISWIKFGCTVQQRKGLRNPAFVEQLSSLAMNVLSRFRNRVTPRSCFRGGLKLRG